MNVLSLFDGISAGQVALERAGIKVDNYYASEIDKYAIQVTMKNYPNTIQLGSVTNWMNWDIDFTTIDLVIGGSPCQGFSIAGKQLNFDDERSKLFFEFSAILDTIKILNPNVKFLLENVRMKKESQDVISEYIGVEPIIINSSLVSAQNRVRLYWTNIPNITEPNDKYVKMVNVLEDDADLKYAISEAKIKRVLETQRGKGFFYNKTHEKCGTLISGYYKQPTDGIYVDLGFKRRLTPTECEKLQTIPVNYTNCVSDSQRYKSLGNSWTIDVIAHIFKNLQ
jgi:site-specific DNA-cytosine methylase